jgi:hypothetical protein
MREYWAMEEWTFKTPVGDRSYSLVTTFVFGILTLFVGCGGADAGFYFCLVLTGIVLALFILGGGDRTRVDVTGLHPRRWYVRRPSVAWAQVAEVDDGIDYNRGGRFIRRFAIDVKLVDGRRVRLPAPVRQTKEEINQDMHVIRSFQQRGIASSPAR